MSKCYSIFLVSSNYINKFVLKHYVLNKYFIFFYCIIIYRHDLVLIKKLEKIQILYLKYNITNLLYSKLIALIKSKLNFIFEIKKYVLIN